MENLKCLQNNWTNKLNLWLLAVHICKIEQRETDFLDLAHNLSLYLE